jgi:hypothetical protein
MCSFKCSPGQASAQQARERRLARLDWLASQVLAVKLQKVEGEWDDVAIFSARTELWKVGAPSSSQHTASPSISHERTLSRLTASKISG